ncbi:hypothetical protein GTO91_12735 [Heliobacterium undosum]|uniref:Uncharacterized protein n=1 Tax=Heliomicrobium undosum TaxID=121734 RepID=A0A845L7F3_9FIRM|nr:hypothetical protein [Heliomicrobium undosum]MZP30580.1 hypothetical protein [Heliomicrobium undosum]
MLSASKSFLDRGAHELTFEIDGFYEQDNVLKKTSLSVQNAIGWLSEPVKKFLATGVALICVYDASAMSNSIQKSVIIHCDQDEQGSRVTSRLNIYDQINCFHQNTFVEGGDLLYQKDVLIPAEAVLTAKKIGYNVSDNNHESMVSFSFPVETKAELEGDMI